MTARGRILGVAARGVDALGNNGLTGTGLATTWMTFAFGYVCQINGLTARKVITAETVARWQHAGILAIPNYEWYEARALAPFAAAIDPPLAVSMILERGFTGPLAACSIDFNVGGSIDSGRHWARADELPVVAEYLAAFQRAYDTIGRRLVAYLGNWAIRWMVDHGADYGLDVTRVIWWGASAWSETDDVAVKYIAPECHIWQHGQQTIDGVLCDLNTVRRNIKGPDMAYMAKTPTDDAVWLIDGGVRTHVAADAFAMHRRNGIDLDAGCTQVEINAVPLAGDTSAPPAPIDYNLVADTVCNLIAGRMTG